MAHPCISPSANLPRKPFPDALQTPIRRLFRWQSISSLDCFRRSGYTASSLKPTVNPPPRALLILQHPLYQFFACASRVSSGSSDQDISSFEPLGRSAIKARDFFRLPSHLNYEIPHSRRLRTIMSSVRTRRQAAAGEETPSKVRPAASEPQQVVMNGNGSAHLSNTTAGHKQENIFLFWPNIIGMVSINPQQTDCMVRL